MHALSDEELLQFNRLGLIPGPHESAEAFAVRAGYCLSLKQHLSAELKANLAEESSSPEILIPANQNLSAIYDIAPDWIPLFFSNYRLTYWHGGCAWIFQVSEDSPTAALIQLRRNLRDSPRYLFYKRDELLSHELAHVGRMQFQEPKYEEMIAYQTTTSAFRRWFGPILQSPLEGVLFVLMLFLIIVFDIFLIALQRPEAYKLALWLKLIPISLIGYALARLWSRQRTFKACINSLQTCLGSLQKARAVVYRLQDREITTFSHMKPEEIRTYASNCAKSELRWHVIQKAYF